MRLSTRRKQEIVRAYVLATGGVLPRDLGQLLRAMREIIPDVSESEVRVAIAWVLRQPLPLPHPKAPRQPSKLLRRS